MTSSKAKEKMIAESRTRLAVMALTGAAAGKERKARHPGEEWDPLSEQIESHGQAALARAGLKRLRKMRPHASGEDLAAIISVQSMIREAIKAWDAR